MFLALSVKFITSALQGNKFLDGTPKTTLPDVKLTKPNTEGLIKKPAKLKNELLDMPETAPLSAADDVLPMQGKIAQQVKGIDGKTTWVFKDAAKEGSNIAIQFGKTENQIYHVFRHTDALGLDRSLVQSTVQNHFKTVSSQVVAGKPFNQIIEIGGQRIQYTAFKLSDGTFNIGRIHGIK